jgi:hypothetical protein
MITARQQQAQQLLQLSGPKSVDTPPAVMSSVALPPASERKRVKVFESKDGNNAYFDKDTGSCKGVGASLEEARIVVLSEDDPSRRLLDMSIFWRCQLRKTGENNRYMDQSE